MKRWKLTLLIAGVFGISAALFYLISIPLNESDISAQNGVLDLRGAGNFKKTIFPLQGQWEFYYGELLQPGDFPRKEKDYIRLPSSWEKSGYPAYGYATYRLVIKTDEDTALMLLAPTMYDAASIWVNGEKIYSEGTIGTSKEQTDIEVKIDFVSFRTVNCEAEILVQICTYNYISSGLSNALKVGTDRAILHNTLRAWIFSAIILGCLLMIGIYHLTLFMFRRRESVYLCFALLCMICFMRFVFESDGINHYFRIITNEKFLFRLFAVLWVAHTYFIVFFSLLVSESRLLKIWLIRKHGYLVLSILPFLFLPYRSGVFTGTAAILFLVPMLFSIIEIWRSPKIKENPYMLMYLFTSVLFIIVGTTSKLIDNNLFMPGLMSNMALMLTQIIILSKNYAGAFKKVEETNANLERLVSERTQELYETNIKLTVSQNALKEMISNFSHDLKTPLMSLGQSLELLNDDEISKNDSERSDYINIAYHKNLDLQRIVRNLFEVTRIETGRLVYRLEWIALSNLFDDVEDKYGAFVKNEKLTLKVLYDEDFKVRIDSDKIWIVFDNIIYNAVRHTGEGGEISVTAARAGEEKAEIIVSDTGSGISEEHLAHIFERFYKVSKSRNDREGDNGIGLYIVKTVVEGMNGTVTARSVLGEGTSFVITLNMSMT